MEFPRADEGNRSGAGRGRGEEGGERGEVAGGDNFAEARGVVERGEGARGGRGVERAGEEGVEEEALLAGAAGGGDQLKPRAGAVAGERAGGEELGEDIAGEGGLDGFEAEGELGFATGDGPRAVADGG